MPISQRFLEKFDRGQILKEFELQENLKTILFFAGGKMGLATKNIFDYMEALTKKAEEGDIQVVAISGKNPKVYKRFRNIAQNNKNVKVLEFTNKVPELMSISDLCITKPGGITSSESLAANVPILAINPIPGQEEENAEYLEEIGVAVWLKPNQNMREVLENTLKEEKLQKLKENTKIPAKPNAATNICKNILG
ncbi:MAG: glycosyltransferase [Clostridia bacterium]|nr:glycosyltransferase [Clostridia bacterium]